MRCEVDERLQNELAVRFHVSLQCVSCELKFFRNLEGLVAPNWCQTGAQTVDKPCPNGAHLLDALRAPLGPGWVMVIVKMAPHWQLFQTCLKYSVTPINLHKEKGLNWIYIFQ